MSAKNYLFTSESVGEGHPDKVCDAVSDSLLDAYIAGDPNSRVAIETMVKTGFVHVAGEVTSKSKVNIEDVVRERLVKIGYDNDKLGYNGYNVQFFNSISKQSSDIAMGVDSSENKEQGAGDQGLMFGFACNETSELMPLPIMLSHRLMKELSNIRRAGTLNYLRPDAKSQVTVQYENDKPMRLDAIVVSTQHAPEVEQREIKDDLVKLLIGPVCGELMDDKTKIFVNPTGRFVIGGPVGDSGVTGRKIIVDSYGGMGRHGGGAFSGKDPSKVDRSAAYAARYIAKNVVAAGVADKCEVQLAYAIGVAEPVSILVDCFGTNKVDENKISESVRKYFPVKPADIIRELDLKKPIYANTAAYGHFGRNEFSWEKVDKAEELKRSLG